jgi:hypothetical protein
VVVAQSRETLLFLDHSVVEIHTQEIAQGSQVEKMIADFCLDYLFTVLAELAFKMGVHVGAQVVEVRISGETLLVCLNLDASARGNRFGDSPVDTRFGLLELTGHIEDAAVPY